MFSGALEAALQRVLFSLVRFTSLCLVTVHVSSRTATYLFSAVLTPTHRLVYGLYVYVCVS